MGREQVNVEGDNSDLRQAAKAVNEYIKNQTLENKLWAKLLVAGIEPHLDIKNYDPYGDENGDDLLPCTI